MTAGAGRAPGSAGNSACSAVGARPARVVIPIAPVDCGTARSGVAMPLPDFEAHLPRRHRRHRRIGNMAGPEGRQGAGDEAARKADGALALPVPGGGAGAEGRACPGRRHLARRRRVRAAAAAAAAHRPAARSRAQGHAPTVGQRARSCHGRVSPGHRGHGATPQPAAGPDARAGIAQKLEHPPTRGYRRSRPRWRVPSPFRWSTRSGAPNRRDSRAIGRLAAGRETCTAAAADRWA